MKKTGILVILLTVLLIQGVQAQSAFVHTPRIDLSVCYDNPTQMDSEEFSIEYAANEPASFTGDYSGIPFMVVGDAIDLDTPVTGIPAGEINPGEIVSGSIRATALDYDGSIWPIGTYPGNVHFAFLFESGGVEFVDIPVETRVVSCLPAPEFPSIFLPATMIIGFLGAVLLIRRTREH